MPEVWDLLERAVNKCYWLQPKYIYQHKIKCKFGCLLSKLRVTKGIEIKYEMYDKDVKNCYTRNIVSSDQDLLVKTFIAWLADVSGFQGKRYFLKYTGGKGQVDKHGNIIR